MITTNFPKTRAFTIAITGIDPDSAMVTITAQDGAEITQRISLRKLAVIRALDPTAKLVVDFLLGETR